MAVISQPSMHAAPPATAGDSDSRKGRLQLVRHPLAICIGTYRAITAVRRIEVI
jgi:hypothetical protein